MSRILFVVPPLTGHVNPAVALAAELVARGHEVALAGHVEIIGGLVPPGIALLPFAGGLSPEVWRSVEERSRGLRGPASLKFLWEEFLLPIGTAMAADTDALVDSFEPDVMVVDQQAIGAALVARRREPRWVTLATTSAEFDDPYRDMAGIGTWVVEAQRGFQRACGVPEAATTDLRFSTDLTLVCSVRALLRDPGGSPPAVYIGSPVGPRPGAADFPWSWIDPRRRQVLVSLGTVTREAGGRFLRAAAQALTSMRETTQAVVVAPPGLVDDLAEAGSADLLVRSHVPQVELLPRLDAVVCHGGNNTVCEALARGVPLVVAPVRDDQPTIAEQVVRGGVGVRVRFGRAGADAVAAAVHEVLTDPRYRRGAGELAREFAAAGGVAAAADHIEKLHP
ncbi:glycosyltransferase [Frankia gtarii]|uniref:glycosyltransferase n=1 Tax=Frankia gtarii TaxID=2950102 RepID=UPI0021BE8ED5|nr:glycosyltransferase [Frankia gtarii]